MAVSGGGPESISFLWSKTMGMVELSSTIYCLFYLLFDKLREKSTWLSSIQSLKLL